MAITFSVSDAYIAPLTAGSYGVPVQVDVNEFSADIETNSAVLRGRSLTLARDTRARRIAVSFMSGISTLKVMKTLLTVASLTSGGNETITVRGGCLKKFGMTLQAIDTTCSGSFSIWLPVVTVNGPISVPFGVDAWVMQSISATAYYSNAHAGYSTYYVSTTTPDIDTFPPVWA